MNKKVVDQIRAFNNTKEKRKEDTKYNSINQHHASKRYKRNKKDVKERR